MGDGFSGIFWFFKIVSAYLGGDGTYDFGGMCKEVLMPPYTPVFFQRSIMFPCIGD